MPIKKLLMIDDDPRTSRAVGRIAGQLGIDFRAVSHPPSATQVFLDYQPDILILNMIMPEMDGIGVLNAVLATGLPTKVVIVSVYGTAYLRLTEGVARFHGIELAAVLRKPLRRAELIKLLSTL